LVPRRPDRSGQPRRGAVGALTLALAAILALGACATLPQYGVATTAVTPHGNCDSSRIVPIGAALNLSGAAGELGQEYLRGLEIAVDQINHSRGLLHYHDCLELLYKDTRGDGHVASRAILDLVNQEGVAFLVSPFLESEIQVAGRDLANAVVPTGSFSSLDRTYDPHRYPKLFPLAASSSAVAATMASFARSRGWTRIGVVAAGDVAGRQGTSDAVQAARRAGVVLAGSLSLAPGVDGATSGLRRLQPSAPQAVLIMGDSPDVADALKARATLGWNVPVIAQDVAGDRSVLDAVGSGSLGGVFAVVPQAVVRQQRPLDPAVVALTNDVRSRMGVRQLTGSIIPYARAVDAISMLGSVATGIHSVNPGPVRTYLENANFQGLLASYAFTSDAHTGMGPDQLTVAAVSSLSDGLFGASRSG
jgi:branched-chain amino acid transport system substrate-binding protein